MKNVTVTLDEKTARWARVEAAQREMSLSSFIREVLRKDMKGQADYEGAMRRFLARHPSELKKKGGYPAIEDLHDRAGLR